MPDRQTVNYRAYLLRLRRDSRTTPWRVTIENPHTGERLGFADLREFVAFLEAETEVSLLPERGETEAENGISS
ncbi:MAG: hypothetical protein FOGNACKC_04340 [Anaerolineae bacterium]|nr:hypothetical protein [Anaerolineae bacterium]